MSFLVSFNGQFSPYVYRAGPAVGPKTLPVEPIEPFDPKMVHEWVQKDEATPNRLKPQVSAYQKQQKQFEKKKLRLFARDIMSSPLHTLQIQQTAQEALEVMQRMGFRHLPVLKGEELVGMLSDRELLHAKMEDRAESLMRPQVIVALDSTRVQDVAHLMLDEKINSLPVVTYQHQLVGIITLTDILKFVITMEEFQL